ncbi:hypothetical protein L5515_002539 [Caenorhabditis briggsae]|uniref:Uncharacterized protein n=1 Tax=Caenorhabditis briggsae TaxID=6238 RepID=A0AAE9E6S3_CAEBR|nr:hypothetical protein L5515_002539 [Caenorhabditis briggsae]
MSLLHQSVQKAVARKFENDEFTDSESESGGEDDVITDSEDVAFDEEPAKTERRKQAARIQKIRGKKRNLREKSEDLLEKLVSKELEISDLLENLGKEDAVELMGKLAEITVKQLKIKCRRVEFLGGELESESKKSISITRRIQKKKLKDARGFLNEQKATCRMKYGCSPAKIRRVRDSSTRPSTSQLPYYIPDPKHGPFKSTGGYDLDMEDSDY